MVLINRMEMLEMNKEPNQLKFFSEMATHQVTAREFFSTSLLHSIERNFGLSNVLISYFDLQGTFLSWVSHSGLLVNDYRHPYQSFFSEDVIRHMVFQDAVRDCLTYFNTTPRMYKSTDIINPSNYDTSPYVSFIKKYFNAHYSTTLAFGMNAYIQVTFFKTLEEGDFTSSELGILEDLYIFISNSYKNFKKHEQSQIIASLQGRAIDIGEKSFLVTDDFMHVLNLNNTASKYLQDIFGELIELPIDSETYCDWLSLILRKNDFDGASIQKRIIKNYVFKIHVHNQCYSNKIVDRYYWITVAPITTHNDSVLHLDSNTLTKTELKVAELMYQGLTYKNIASELIVSYHTIKKHVQNIYIKCNVKSRHELYNWLENNKK